MKMALSKIGKGGGDEAESQSYVRIFWGTSITNYFKKNHVELFFVFFKARVVFYEYRP